MKQSYLNFIFDLYGTLADIHTDEEKDEYWERFAAFLQPRGILEELGELRAFYHASCSRLERGAEEMLAAAGIPGPAEIDIRKVWESLAHRHGLCFTEQQLLEISGEFRRITTEKLRLFPGAEELLLWLRQSGKNVVLLTNAQESFTLPELEQLGIVGAFDRIFISSGAGVKKPSPAFFALLRENGFLPADSLMIGNDDVCDCRGAAAAGMDSLYIRTEQSPAPAGALPENCREITDLGQVFPFGF